MEVPKPASVKNGSTKKRKQSPTTEKRCLKNELENGLLESSATSPLTKVRWFRIVLDEAQSIKNRRTHIAQACWSLHAERRWCLSGTPIQNSVDDLYSYFRFLRYDPYSVYESFCSLVKLPISKCSSDGYKKLQAVLRTIMLRRTKDTLIDGEPVVKLPPKLVKLKTVEFSKEERDFYTRLEADYRAKFQAYAACGTIGDNYASILLMLLRLRQACSHPFLVQGHGSRTSSSVPKSSIQAAKNLPQEWQVCLLDCLESCLAYCGICSVSGELTPGQVTLDVVEDAVVSLCGHVFCNQCFLKRVIGDEEQCPHCPVTNCLAPLDRSSVFSKDTLKCCQAAESSDLRELVEPSLTRFNSSKIKAALEVLETLAKPHVGSFDESDNDMHFVSNNSGVAEKAVVFSQWTSMLDILEDRLKKSSIQYRRLDGTMSVTARDKAVKDFNILPEVTVILMSLKAASLGLNLVAACHVLLLDLWWNPTTEDQAIDRAHRIGQTRPVTVVKLAVKDTVEDRILALQQTKTELVASAFGENENGSGQAKLTVEELKHLFGQTKLTVEELKFLFRA